MQSVISRLHSGCGTFHGINFFALHKALILKAFISLLIIEWE